jgi:hypothetical protein
MKTCGVGGGVAPPFLTSALNGGVSFTLLPPYPRGKSPATHRIGGWVGPRVGMNAVEKKKICACRKSNPGRLSRGPSLYQLSYPGYFLKSRAFRKLDGFPSSGEALKYTYSAGSARANLSHWIAYACGCNYTTQHHIQRDRNLSVYICENFRSWVKEIPTPCGP